MPGTVAPDRIDFKVPPDIFSLRSDGTMADNPLLSRVQRYGLLTKVRWLFLILAAAYGAGAGLVYALSDFGWFLSPGQFYGLLLVIFGILGYNALYEFAPQRMAASRWGDQL